MSEKKTKYNKNEFYGLIVKNMVKKIKEGKIPQIWLVYQLHAGEKNEIKSNSEALLRHTPVDGYEVSPYFLFEAIRAYDKENSREKGENTYDLEKAITLTEFELLCQDLDKNIDTLGNDFCVSLNVNPSLFNEEFVENYLDILKRHPKLSAKNVGVELVETSRYPIPSDVKAETNDEDREKVKDQVKDFYKNMARLQKEGTIFSLDDFDSGELREIGQEVLETYPFDVLKFDRELVDDLSKCLVKAEYTKNKNSKTHSVGNNVLARAIKYMRGKKNLNRQLPKELVFEGYEEDHKSFLPELIAKYYGKQLEELGVKEISFQGYGINKPMPIKEIVEMVNAIEHKKQPE